MSDATIHPIACGAGHPELQVTCSRMRAHKGAHLGSNGQDHGVTWTDQLEDEPAHYTDGDGYGEGEDVEPEKSEGPLVLDYGPLIGGPHPDLARVYVNLRALTAILVVLLLIGGPGLLILIYRAAL